MRARARPGSVPEMARRRVLERGLGCVGGVWRRSLRLGGRGAILLFLRAICEFTSQPVFRHQIVAHKKCKSMRNVRSTRLQPR